MSRTRVSDERGFSVVELIAVLMITGVLTALAVTQFGQTRNLLREQNLVRELKVNLERARFDSVKRNARTVATQASVRLMSATTFEVIIDSNQNGTFESFETRTVNLGIEDAAKIVGTSNYPITIRFDERGNVSALNSLNQPVNPTFTICSSHCDANSVNATNASVLAVTPSGTVAMLRGGETLETIASPNVSNVSPSNSIKCGVYVRQYGNSNTCQSLVTNPVNAL